MIGSELKAKWRRGELTLGLSLQSIDSGLTNVLAHGGFDWMAIDTEHQAINPETLALLLAQFRDSPTTPLVRVAENRPILIRQALDFGAEGVLVPMVISARGAERAVAATRYPPAGIRGAGPRAVTANYRELTTYLATANERAIVALIIEDIRAVERIDAILAVPGVDMVVVGQADLSASLGVLWQVDEPRVTEATLHVIERARAAGVAATVGVDGPVAAALAWLGRGATSLMLGMEWTLLQRLSRELTEAIRREAPAVMTPMPGIPDRP